jgi:hypothetical protein
MALRNSTAFIGIFPLIPLKYIQKFSASSHCPCIEEMGGEEGQKKLR